MSVLLNNYFADVVSGEVKNQDFLTILGSNSLSDNTLTTIWQENIEYIFPTTAQKLTAESDNANDTAGGSGAQSIRISGLLFDYSEFTEDVILDGANPVNTVEEFIRVNNSSILTAGSSGFNEGVIKIKNLVDGNVLNRINSQENQNDGCIFTVPLGKKGVVYAPSTTLEKDKKAQIFLSFTQGDTSVTFKRLLYTIFDNTIIPATLNAIINLSEKSDIKIQSNNLQAGATILTSAFQILLKQTTNLQFP